MKKKSVTDRLQLLGKGRAPYLEFLRNLTPQILLLTFVWVVGSELNFTEIDLSNWPATLLFYVLLAAFFTAFWANSSLFHNKCFSQLLTWLRRVHKLILTQNSSALKILLALISAIWKRRFIELLELLFAFYLLQIVLAIEVVQGLKLAINLFDI